MALFASGSFLSRWQRSRRFRVLNALVCVLFVNSLATAIDPPPDKPATYPAWWFSQGLIQPINPNNSSPHWQNHDYASPDDYATANVGQLKQMATKAAAELNAHLPGGAGAPVNQLIAQWTTPPAGTPAPDDYSALTLGQLKNVAQPFYDRLIAVHYTNAYPWISSGLAADDYSVANVGQLKNIFSFDVAFSTLNDGLPDWWVLYYNLGSVTDPTLASADFDGDGISNLQEFLNGTDPTNYYNGQTVALTLVSGGSQTGMPGSFLAQPIVISVTKGDTANTPWTNAPVTFSADSGLGQYATANDGTTPLQTSLTVQTDSTGQATVYFQPAASLTGSGYATASHQNLPFSESGYDPTAAPAAPPTVQTAATGTNQTTLTWSTTATNSTGSQIQQWTYATGWQTIATVGADTSSYTATNLSSFTTAYRVVSFNEIGATTSTTQSSDGSDLNMKDTDGDGLTDAQEIERGTDPNNPNTNGSKDANGNDILDGQKAFPLVGEASLTQPAVPEGNYLVIDLATLGIMSPAAINDSLQILDNGTAQIPARIWSNGTFTSLPFPGDSSQNADAWEGLSNAGQTFTNQFVDGYTDFWHPGASEALPLSNYGGGSSSLTPQRMTPSGLILGLWQVTEVDDYFESGIENYFGAVAWNAADGSVTPLGPTCMDPNQPDPQIFSEPTFYPYSANSANIIVGEGQPAGLYTTPEPRYAAVCVLGNNPTPLPSTHIPNIASCAFAINNSVPPLIAGYDGVTGDAFTGDLWQKNGGGWDEIPLQAMNSVVGRVTPISAGVSSMNDRCEMIGWFEDQDGHSLGNFWQNGHIVDLNTRTVGSGYSNFYPIQLNNNGVILATATAPNGQTANVILLSVEPSAPAIYMFSGHDSDTITLDIADLPGCNYEWRLKNPGGAQGQFQNSDESDWSATGTASTVTFRAGKNGTPNIAGDTRAQASGSNTIQLLINGTVYWEEPLEVIQIQPRSSWGALAANTAIMSGMSGINQLTVHHSSREAFGIAEILRIQKEHMGLLNKTGWFNIHPHATWGDIGYHFILDPSNDSDTVQLYEGRQLEGLGLGGGKYTVPSAVLNKNTMSGIDVCVLGNYQTGSFSGWMKGNETFSEIRREKLEKVLAALSLRYKTPTNDGPAYPPTTPQISYHQQLAQKAPVYETTECPGNTVISTMPTTQTKVKNDLK